VSEPSSREPRRWLGFTKRALILHGVLTLITLGFWLVVPAAIYTWRRGGGARKVSYGLWGIAALFAFGLIWAVSLDSSEERAATGSTTTTAETQPDTTEATTTEAESPPTTAPATTETKPPDTGRMSDGEYANFSRVLSEVDSELSDYGDGLAKCSVLFEALQLADASDCIGEAYAGVGDQMLVAYSTAEDLQGDVATACLKALKLYRQRLDVYFGWHERTQDAGENLQFDEYNTLASLSGSMTKRYRQGRDWVLRDCEPR
jgi:hypothetical protein